MENIVQEKNCLVCNRRIVGRSDKKFCSDACRLFYNNQSYRNKRKKYNSIEEIKEIYSKCCLIYDENNNLMLRIILFIVRFCKFLSKFGAH